MSQSHMVILAGTGIKSLSHLTKETESAVQKSDKVLYLVNEPIIEEWVVKNAPASESMYGLYTLHDSRRDNYKAIVNKILIEHEAIKNLCVLIYGHPTVFAYPGVEAIRQIERKGGRVKILPGVSAEDCLFADLRINPGDKGCLSLEATEFLLYDKAIIPAYHVVFWQVGQIGNTGVPGKGLNKNLLSVFCERVCAIYEDNVEAILYEASLYPNVPPKIQPLKVLDLMITDISTISLLYLPPKDSMPENKAIRNMLEL